MSANNNENWLKDKVMAIIKGAIFFPRHRVVGTTKRKGTPRRRTRDTEDWTGVKG